MGLGLDQGLELGFEVRVRATWAAARVTGTAAAQAPAGAPMKRIHAAAAASSSSSVILAMAARASLRDIPRRRFPRPCLRPRSEAALSFPAGNALSLKCPLNALSGYHHPHGTPSPLSSSKSPDAIHKKTKIHHASMVYYYKPKRLWHNDQGVECGRTNECQQMAGRHASSLPLVSSRRRTLVKNSSHSVCTCKQNRSTEHAAWVHVGWGRYSAARAFRLGARQHLVKAAHSRDA